MDRTTLTLLITLVLAIVFSIPVSRRSEQKDRIQGGILARIMHAIGVTIYLGVLPAALVGSILVGPVTLGIPLALICLGLAFVFFLLYGMFERPARREMKAEDRGWTAQDARSSGL